jgi:purine-binding chemotaxis protein CheW
MVHEDIGGQVQRAVELVVVDVGGQRWALPLEAVERALELVAVSVLPETPVGIVGAINVHGEPVPVLDLDARIGRPPRERGTRGSLLLVRTARRRVALPVDEVLGVVTVDAGAVAPPPESLPAPVAGIAALPDGVLLISDVHAFLSADDERAVTAALQ